MTSDPAAQNTPLVLIAVVLALTFVAGMVLGTYQTRIEATQAKCAIPCGLTHVEVDTSNSDWTDWTCRCIQPHP